MPLPPHRVLLLAEGDAPYDDVGIAILEVDDYGAFADMERQCERPEDWPAV